MSQAGRHQQTFTRRHQQFAVAFALCDDLDLIVVDDTPDLTVYFRRSTEPFPYTSLRDGALKTALLQAWQQHDPSAFDAADPTEPAEPTEPAGPVGPGGPVGRAGPATLIEQAEQSNPVAMRLARENLELTARLDRIATLVGSCPQPDPDCVRCQIRTALTAPIGARRGPRPARRQQTTDHCIKTPTAAAPAADMAGSDGESSRSGCADSDTHES